MKEDLLNLIESKLIINDLIKNFNFIDGLLVLDKSKFCIGCKYIDFKINHTNIYLFIDIAFGKLTESDSPIINELTSNVCLSLNSVYKIKLNFNKGHLFLINNELITLAILKLF